MPDISTPQPEKTAAPGPQVQMQLNVPQTDDHEGQMARADLYRAAKHAMKLFQMIQDGQDLEGWVQAKITKSADYLDSIYHYMEYQMKFGNGGEIKKVDDITGEAEAPSDKEISEEDDEQMESIMNYEQKLKSLLEGAYKKEMKKKPAAKKAAKTDEALDINLIKAAQKDAEGKPLAKKDAESDANVKKPYGYRGASGAEGEDEGDKRPGRKRKSTTESTDDSKAKADEKKKKEEKKKKIAKIVDEDSQLLKTIVKRVVEAKKKGSKPDFLDVDKDGDKKEPMKKASKEADKGGEKKTAKGVTAAQKKLPPGLQKAIAKKKGASESTVSAKKVVAESVELNRIKMLSGLK